MSSLLYFLREWPFLYNTIITVCIPTKITKNMIQKSRKNEELYFQIVTDLDSYQKEAAL